MFLRGVDTGDPKKNDPDSAARTEAAAGGNVGDAVGSVQASIYASHSHTATDSGHSHPTQGYLINVGTAANMNFSGGAIGYAVSSGTGVAQANISVSSTGGSETRPINAYVNYIIKL